MKKILSLLSLAALTVGLLGSCSKIDERISNLEKKVNGIESEQIASIKSQVDAINTSIADLGTIRQNVQTLMNTTLSKENIEELRRADEALGRRIDELKSYTDVELKKYATTEWVKATFATLEQHQWTCDTIAKIDTRIGALDTMLSQSLSGLESSLKQWVNEQLDAYYTAAQMDAKLDVMRNDINNAKAQGKTATDKADSIATELTTLKTAVDTAKANIRSEYKAAVQSAIETSEGKLSQALKDSIAKVNDKITALDTRVSTLESTVDALTGRVDKLEKMIQSVTILPAYTDGSVEAVNGTLTIDFVVSPAAAVKGVTKDSIKVLVHEAKVQTKAASYTTIPVASADVDEATGDVTITADISGITPAEGKAFTVAVNIKNVISDFTTEFVPVYAVTVAPEGFVDLGVKDANGKPLYWAKCNLGASKPEEYGKYYSWGDVTGQTPSGSTFSKSFSWDNDVFGQSFNKVAQTTACPDGVLAQTYDVAYQTNNAWRMPTREDFSGLAKQCFLEWTDNYNSTGVKGVIVWKAKGDDAGWFKPSTAGKGLKIKDDGSSYNAKEDHTFSNTYAIGTDPCVFFPAAGYGDGTSLYNANTSGSYWSGSLFSLEPTNARLLFFGVSNVNLPGFDYRCNGSPVRPVTSDAAPAPAPLPAGALKGVFSVGATKKVQFSRGNLYWDGDSYEFEENQYTIGTWNAENHVNYFFWSNSSSVARAASYADASAAASDVFFTNATAETVKADFTVSGVTGEFRTLSAGEWTYILSTRANAADLLVEDVTVCGVEHCLVIAPDACLNSYVFDKTKKSYDAADWATAEAAGLVCLPPAGYRDGTEVKSGEGNGFYWISTTDAADKASNLGFKKSDN